MNQQSCPTNPSKAAMASLVVLLAFAWPGADVCSELCRRSRSLTLAKQDPSRVKAIDLEIEMPHKLYGVYIP